jgi:hypothetical protein
MKQHQWVAIATIPLSQASAAEAMARGLIGRDIREKDIKDIQIGCINCDQEIRQAFGKPCEAPTYDYDEAQS